MRGEDEESGGAKGETEAAEDRPWWRENQLRLVMLGYCAVSSHVGCQVWGNGVFEEIFWGTGWTLGEAAAYFDGDHFA